MTKGSISKVLIANRGEISVRAQRACKKLGIGCVAVYTEPDALSLHVLQAPESVCLGAAPKEYLNAARILEVAKSTGCDAVFPGYGFLSENTEFSAMCEDNGIAFLGPTAETMGMFAQKHTARELAERAEVPVLSGSPLLVSAEDALECARTVGLPILLKATGGGGGIGIHICRTEEEVADNFASASRQGAAAFGDAGVFVEKYVQNARHIEVQIFGDGAGNVVAFPERECSIQRRHQKVLEESPSPFVTPEMRVRLQAAAVRLGQLAKYRSAGTVEFIVDDDTGEFYFLEVNTRLQVEHGITEMVSGVDLVAWMFQLQGAPGDELPADLASYQPAMVGQAIEVRICAEDPAHGYRPCTGILGLAAWPKLTECRVDTWVETGVEVSAYYDSLLAKLMVYSAEGRPQAIAKMCAALDETQLKGVVTNLEFLRVIAASPRYAAGQTTTKFVEHMDYSPHAVEFLDAGLQTTVQDYPGRVALWSVGVPPSGPMDDLSFRLANSLVGNPDAAAGLEVTLSGPTMKFLTDSVVAVCGAEAPVTLDGQPVPMWSSFAVKRGQVVKVGATQGGSRAYVAVAGGFDVPEYLGSKSTFPGGAMGGHQGRALRPGDMLFLAPADTASLAIGAEVPLAWRPSFCSGVSDWTVGVLPGPQANPDYFTDDDIATLLSTPYKIHHNSNRLGIRMEGPRPQFARTDGGEGGSHPSNVHDHVYALGTINFTGDMPVVLMVDGPSLGGFVCPATITTTELWKMGQVRPGDAVRFRKLSIEEAYTQRFTVDQQVSLVRQVASGALTAAAADAEMAAYKVDVPECPPTEAVLRVVPAVEGRHPGAKVRLAGDRYIFLEYGPMELDISLRVRVHEIEQYLAAKKIDGLIETSPGVRSVVIEYDQRRLPLPKLLEVVDEAEANMAPADAVKLPYRVLHLPLAFNEKWTHEAISRYMRSIRSEAPYLPSNVKFVAANNGLEGDPVEAVRKVVFEASYQVLGLGDVYLGAPCAVPVDPRHRLVVPKYNPARTYTPEGSVGIGGAYMCIYPMNSPGGYQLVGRTLPIWNPFTRTGPFTPGKPWLLRNFDQVKYYEVSEDELEVLRNDFKNGRLQIKIEDATFDVHQYNEFMKSVAGEYEELRQRQRKAMAEQNSIDAEMLAKMDAAKLETAPSAAVRIEMGEDDETPFAGLDGTVVSAAVTGTVWEVKVEVGAEVKQGDTLVVLEAMKMEYAVLAPCDGTVTHVRAVQGDMVHQGTALCLVE
ncbi:urea carboxylase [Micractinium conductrix]|uniref:Urea carboxylase n=1 Tax=Micractinium conductrix TaxID=554055 RepID=A0A2P6V6B9_9CHLO|nr:urea carboxylase [Micractinium conductrix]|eukprot:PSC69627.1 urea carboxylase [Micractinium conductrix]